MAGSIDQLKQSIIQSLDIRSFYEQSLNGQQLPAAKSDGWTERVLCPLHDDVKTPSFFVNVLTGGFRCHACGAGGSIFDFWILSQGLSPEDKTNFSEALVHLANQAGVDISEWKESNYKSKPKRVDTKKKAKEPDTFIPKLNKADSNDSSKTPISKSIVERHHKALRPEHYKFFLQKRGLKKRTIEKAMLGWDETWPGRDTDKQWFNGRYTIPVRNRSGEYRNIRGYSPRCDPAFKMANYVIDKNKPTEQKFGSPPRLYNLDRMIEEDWQHVVICEGEFDAMLLTQFFEDMGFERWGGVSGTHGAKTFEPEWIPDLFGRYVYLCLDCDDEGKLAAANIASKHFLRPMAAGKFSSVKIIDLPLEGTKELKDISDYFLKAEHTGEDFVAMCDEAPELISGGLSNDEATTEPEEVDNLVTAIKDRRYIDKRIRVPLTISGTTSKVYHAIREYKVYKCPMIDKNEECCSDGAGVQSIPYGHPLFIASCMQKESANLNAIAAMTCQKGQKCKVKAVRKVVMEEYFAHQVVKRWRAEEVDGRLQNSQELVQSPIYVLQPPDNIDIEPQNYMATGFIRTHPHTSMATLFVEELVPMEEDWKKFTLETNENRELISKIKEDFTVDEIISEITNGVTKIYEADHILYAVLLSYLSPLWFFFNGNLLRGWINTAIIGDSGTGKSATYIRLSDWLELGDLFSALSGTRTGLLYAIKQKSGEWHVSIGRYVQASCKIIAIDETQETTPEEVKRMAIAMDTGFLKIDQVASGGYHTQTRTIFLLNPKDSQGRAATISDFVNGCESLRECFDPMFIRRLDLAVFTTSNHDYDFYNKKVELDEQERSVKPSKISAKMFRTLIYWAWSRKPEQIIWEDEATNECLRYATELSKVYGHADEVPLVNPQDFRENLARLSNAYAVLDRSFSEDLESVIIKSKHVSAMAKFVDIIYASPACNLKQKSKHSKAKNTLEDFEKIKENFENAIERAKHSPSSGYSGSNHFCQMLLLLEQLNAIRKSDLADQLGVSPKWVRSRTAILQGFRLIEMGRYGYKKTKKFNLFMQRWREDEGIEEMLDNVYSDICKNAMDDDDSEEYFNVYNDDSPGKSSAIDPFA